MKNFIIGIILAIACMFIAHYEHNYTRNVVVTQVECQKTTVKDNSNNYWTFYGSDYKVGDSVILKMYDNNTPNNIYDDIITGVK